MKFHLAQINIGRMLAPIDSMVMAGFVNNLDRINSLAENYDGFVWRLKDDSNNATSIKIYDDEFLIVNMSVWESKEALHKFVYQSAHTEVFRQRKQWFEKMDAFHMALWYVEQGKMPTVAQAIERLDYIRKHGATPFAFAFKDSFSAEEAEAYLSTKCFEN